MEYSFLRIDGGGEGGNWYSGIRIARIVPKECALLNSIWQLKLNLEDGNTRILARLLVYRRAAYGIKA